MTSKNQIGVIEANNLNDIIYNNGKKCYIGGLRVPYMPGPEDCWSNPYDEYKNTRLKSSEWQKAIKNNEFALDCSGNKYPVANYGIGDLAFVAGLWRIQNKCPYKITRVRDKDMVLIKKLDRVENTLFDFYSAKMVNYNCYGPFVIDCERANYVVARYETDKETYMGYGTSIEAARAYLGLKLYDEYKDVINAIACKNKIKKTSR